MHLDILHHQPTESIELAFGSLIFVELSLSLDESSVEGLQFGLQLHHGALFVLLRGLGYLLQEEHLRYWEVGTLLLIYSFCCLNCYSCFIRSLFWLLSILTTPRSRDYSLLFPLYMLPPSKVTLTLPDPSCRTLLVRMSIDCLLTLMTSLSYWI